MVVLLYCIPLLCPSAAGAAGRPSTRHANLDRRLAIRSVKAFGVECTGVLDLRMESENYDIDYKAKRELVLCNFIARPPFSECGGGRSILSGWW